MADFAITEKEFGPAKLAVPNMTKTATTPTRGGVSTTPTPQVEGIKKAKKINIFKPKEVEVKKPETKSGIDAALEGLEE